MNAPLIISELVSLDADLGSTKAEVITSVAGIIARAGRADADGLTVRKLFGRQQLPWPAVAIRVNTTRRFGRSIHLLELDTGEHLVVLTRTDLGAEPQDVADRLAQLRP